MNLDDRIQRGLDGKYKGLGNGFQRINEYIFGIQRATYYLLGGASGTFKTTLADFMLLNAMMDAQIKNIKLKVFYYSYEIDELTKKCNWLSAVIFRKYGVVVFPEKIKGLGDFRLNKEEQDLVNKEIPYIDSLFNSIDFRFVPTNPTGMFHELWTYGEKTGSLIYKEYVDEYGQKKQRIDGYKPKDEEAYTLVILDHLYHLKKEREFSTKEVIDKYSEYCVLMRNLFGFSFINIQQFNRSLSAIDRQKYKGVDISPQESDFKETGNTYQDADVVFGTMCPYKMDMKTCIGYNITKLKSNMIMFKIIKNRLSKDNIAVGLYCNPKAGSFEELPPKEQMTDEIYNRYQ